MSDPGLPDLPDPSEQPPGGDPGSVPDTSPPGEEYPAPDPAALPHPDDRPDDGS